MTGILHGQEFRRVLSHYPTGVCAITAIAEGVPAAFVVGSFTSVSLDPPLVAFLPDRKSTTWPKIAAAGRFCVNVLSADQQDLCRVLSSKAPGKFDEVCYRLSATGIPILEGVVAWLECDLYAIHEAGDHFIAIGQVRAMDVEHPHAPLIFFGGGYGRFAPNEGDRFGAEP